MKSIKKKPIMILLMAALMATFIVGLCACGKSDSKKVACVDDLEGAKIGVQLGTTGDIYVSDYENDGSGTKVERYNKGADAVQALKVGKIDCVVIDEQPALAFVKENKGLKILDEEFTNEDYAFCLKKGNTELRDKVNTALEKLQQDGTVQSIIDNYIGSEDQVGKTPYVKKDIDRSNGTLKVGTNAEFPPYEYYEDNKVTGIDMDIMQAIADELGMDMQVEDMQFDAIIAAVSSGKVDVGAAGFTVTEDRQKNVDFTDTYITTKQEIIVKDSQSGSSIGIKEKLYDNFVKDNRYMYIVKGLGNTIVITIFAVMLGIAVIAFGLNSAAYVAEIVRSGIMSVDIGQFEAGRSLGLNYRQTMKLVIIPQVVKNILPALLNEFISLLKETSISGYIGMMDLTKGGDIIRSNTYEAFIPLIAVALIYLVIVMLLSHGVSKLERRLRSNER